MLAFPDIDPIIFALGPLKVRWYGMMYLLGFMAAFWLGRRCTLKSWSPLRADQVEDLIFYGALGAVLGGRVGYVFFYGFERLLQEPLWAFKVWEGGMSFHGGLLGVLVALVLFAKKIKKPLASVCDFVAPLAPIGLGLGRLANFINAELYGRETDVAWAMVFPSDSYGLARHPSQLYQFALEGVLLFAVVWWFAQRKRPAWSITGLFLIVYGAARYTVEFFREPDASLAFEWMTRGQLLSLPMILLGVIMLVSALRGPEPDGATTAKAPAPNQRRRGKKNSPQKTKPKQRR